MADGRTLREFDDAGPDEFGRRSFSLFWVGTDGKLRAQCFFAEPGGYRVDGPLRRRPGEDSCDAAARILGAGRRGWHG